MVDVNLKVPAIEKLLDYAASGIGAVAGPMLASWRARKEAEARLIGARAEADSLTLIADARNEARRSLVEPDSAVSEMLEIDPDGGITQRIAFQEQKRQANIAAVVRDAAAELGDKEVPDHEPDPDWTARFFDNVQDVSSDDMQKLWSQVLSGQVESPGRTSLRTLDVLKNMTSTDAQVFQKVSGYVIQGFIFNSDKSRMNYPELSYDNLLSLQDAGLINAGPMLVRKISFNKHPHNEYILYQNLLLRISAKEEMMLEVPNFLLTSAGEELHQFAKCEPNIDYLKSFASFLRSKGCELSYAHILEKRPDGSILHTNPFVPVEPEDQAPRNAAP